MDDRQIIIKYKGDGKSAFITSIDYEQTDIRSIGDSKGITPAEVKKVLSDAILSLELIFPI